MKKVSGYLLREVADEYVLVSYGERAEEVNEALTFSETAAFIYKHVEEAETLEELIQLVCEEYQVEKALVSEDVKEVVAFMKKKGIIA